MHIKISQNQNYKYQLQLIKNKTKMLFEEQVQESDSSNESKNEGKVCKKTKKIEKKEKQSKESIKKNEKKRQEEKKTNLGRPMKVDCQFDVPEDITASLKMILITHFEKMGLHKGLVFKDATRKKLREQQRNRRVSYEISWQKRHYWNETQEKQKIKELIGILSEKYSEENIQKITSKLLDISQIISGECTSEIYKFLIEIILILDSQDQQIQRKFEQSKNSYIFLTGKFTKCKVPYDIELVRDEGIINSLLNKLYFASVKQMKKIIEHTINE